MMKYIGKSNASKNRKKSKRSSDRNAPRITVSRKSAIAMYRRTCWVTFHDAAIAIGNMKVVTMTSQIENPSTPTNHDSPTDSIHGCLDTICRPGSSRLNCSNIPTDTANTTRAVSKATHRAASSDIFGHRSKTGIPTSGAKITSVSQGASIRPSPPRRAAGRRRRPGTTARTAAPCPIARSGRCARCA